MKTKEKFAKDLFSTMRRKELKRYIAYELCLELLHMWEEPSRSPAAVTAVTAVRVSVTGVAYSPAGLTCVGLTPALRVA